MEKRHEDFLVNVLDFVDCDARAQEAGNGRANVVERRRQASGSPRCRRSIRCARIRTRSNRRASSIFFILATLPSVIASASFHGRATAVSSV